MPNCFIFSEATTRCCTTRCCLLQLSWYIYAQQRQKVKWYKLSTKFRN
jgi:hypothetical protein